MPHKKAQTLIFTIILFYISPLHANSNNQNIYHIIDHADFAPPSFLHYFQDKHSTPSRHLESNDNKRLDIIIFSKDDDGDYSNCQKIYPPIIISGNSDNYAAYKYREEEIRGIFSNHYFYVKLRPNSFDYCKNSEALSRHIKFHKETRAAVVEALTKQGCTITDAGLY
ncbi:hypothetical protein [Azospira inquinata]|uniref:Uncharacterized protein n=1 Tax=Azospira inquinata TaxID=2785627 RepID=A0A975SM46_9RHOO|nr:hypothetical protein [Azospira inquinata]QWT45795.1 hypothetical protein J8L76_12795 [Azospira inquinata]QWT48883.1 hypothetical protein Azoinq_13815 [Azospira inquinata]